MKSISRIANLRHALAGIALCAAAAVSANTITVTSLADDVFPDNTGAIVDINGAAVTLLTQKCTLRMAIAAANLDFAVGGANGCPAGSGADTIQFGAVLALTPATPGTIALADRGMSEAPASYTLIIQSALIVSGPLTITGPGSAALTIDGGLPGNSGRRLLTVSDGSGTIDSPFSLGGVRLLRGRAIEQSAGCLFSGETTTLGDVIFESCESVGGLTQNAFGGALGIGNTNTAGNYRPNVSITNTLFVANRTTRGTNTVNLPQGGAAFIGSGSRWVGIVTITDSRFLGNSSDSAGGLYLNDANAVSMNRVQFLSNTATGNTAFLNGGRFGGFRIATVSGNVNLTSVAAIGNTATVERAGYSIITVGGTTTIVGGTVVGNVAIGGRIGGFEVLTDNFDAGGNCLGTQKSPVVITGLNVEGNRAATSNGGFRVQCSGTVTLSDMAVVNNVVFGSPVAGSGGNAAGNVATNLAVTMNGIQFLNNQTYSGNVDGGFGVMTVQDNSSFDGTGLLFRGNRADQDQGALTLRANGAGRNFTLTNSAFVDNVAQNGSVAALNLDKTGNYTIRNSTFSGNRSAAGGAVFVNMNAASGSNAVVFENVTSGRGAGGNLALEVQSFGMPNTPSGTVTIRNSILASGTSGIGSTTINLVQVPNVTYAVSNSLIENSGFGVPPGICGVNGNLCNVDARLENIAADLPNGVTTMTHALKPGSPALDAGSSSGVAASDQRGMGFPRIVGAAVDMGAFESPALPALCSLDVDGNGSVNALTDGLLILRAMFGLTGTSVTAGALGGGATRLDWTAVRGFLNGSCGANFAL